MKKIIIITLLLLVSIGIVKEVKADTNNQMARFLERYALTGEQLDSFENQSTLLQRAKKEVIFPSVQEYEEYVNLNMENNSKTILSYDEYTDFMNPSEPTTKVENDYRRANYVPVPGDILITNGTSSSDFMGHAGIFLGAGTILSIEGYWNTNNMVLPSFILPYALPNVFLNGTSHVATLSY